MTEMIRILGIVGVVAICTFFTRVFPFIIFGKQKELPPIVQYMGKVLPMAVMGILVVYCLKEVYFTAILGYLPSVVGVATVVVIHLWKRNNLISIGMGTLVYMITLQLLT